VRQVQSLSNVITSVVTIDEWDEGCALMANKMVRNQEQWVCAHCGYTGDGKFEGDICPRCGLTYWKCANCGFLITAGVPPDTCSQCGEKCNFLNVTCYVPECGGPEHIDPRL
jgi:rubredoxin